MDSGRLISDFDWYTYPSGFDVVTASPDFYPEASDVYDMSAARSYLVPRDPFEARVKIRPFERRTDPLAEFTRCRKSDHIKRFANKWGPLWLGLPETRSADPRFENPFIFDARHSEDLRLVNDVDLIFDHACRMRDLIEMQRKPEGFEVIERGTGFQLTYAFPHHEVPYSIPVAHRSIEHAYKFAIAYLVNREIKNIGAIDFRLMPTPRESFAMAMQPPSLLAALWLRLALNFTEDAEVIVCENCNEAFLHATKSRGKPRRFCSERCRKANQRKR